VIGEFAWKRTIEGTLSKRIIPLASEVTTFLDELKHPLRNEIEQLRRVILKSVDGLIENIKWNGPNYCFGGDDRITMRIHPPDKIQLIFHRGAKKLVEPKDKLINDSSGLLDWKENDRAVVTFKSRSDIESASADLERIVAKWIKAAK
jgi:hypothetical protein